MPYLLIKHLHLTLAALSLLFYALRGYWLIRASPSAESRWVRIFPHILYTALIGAGAALATLSGQWGQTWIWLKLCLLVAFVVLGVLAFSRRSTLPRARRISLWGMGLVLFIMIFAVAAHHHALTQAAVPTPLGVGPAHE
jgi:uncharacterized membrane protein SirB2